MRAKLLIISAIFFGLIYSQSFDCKPSKMLKKSSASITRARFDINNISTYIWNNGDMDIMPSGLSGFEFPKYNGKHETVFFETGIVWGAIVGDSIKVGGSTYSQGLQPGSVLEDGTAEEANSELTRIYRVRPDYETADLSEQAAVDNITENQIREQYEKDWEEWPADKGAPYEDINANGQYDPETDIPGVIGADQTLWFVANDLDVETCKDLYGSTPMGLEMQATFWGYNAPEPYGNVIYSKYKIINKSQNTFENMYIGYWSDPDLGGPGDDAHGIDTTLNLHFTYNGPYVDEYYSIPPASGIQLLKGPQKSDGSFYGLTNFMHYICGGIPSSPQLRNYSGTLGMYNSLRSLIPSTGNKYYYDGNETRFPLSGNPFTQEGDTFEKLRSCGDAKGVLSSGPFDLAPGESTEIVYAKFVAMGTDRMNSLELLKDYAYQLKNTFENNRDVSKINAPISPEIDLSDAGESILIEWNENEILESYSENGYEFQGYNLYQLYEDAPLTGQGIKIASFDKTDGISNITSSIFDAVNGTVVEKSIQTGSDDGLQYSYEITEDFMAGENLRKGKDYYFALTAYTYNGEETILRKSFESLPNVFAINYHSGIAGHSYMDEVKLNHVFGSGTGDIELLIENPAKITNHKYQIEFTPVSDDSVTWSLKDIDMDIYKIENADLSQIPYNQWRDEYNYYYCDGIKFKVNADLKIHEKLINVKLNNVNLPKIADSFGEYISYMFQISSLDLYTYSDYPQFLDDNLTDSYELRFTGVIENTPDGDIIKDGTGSMAIVKPFIDHKLEPNPGSHEPFLYRIPWEVWNIRTNQKVNTVYLIDDMHNFNSSIPQVKYNYFFILNTPYSEELPQGELSELVASTQNRLIFTSRLIWNYQDKIIFEYTDRIRDDIFELNTALISGTNNDPELPKDFSLEQNYPNPFNPSTIIKYSLPENGLVKLELFNVLGQKVSTLVNTEQVAGHYQQRVDMSRFSSGVYFYRINVNGNFVETKKMMLLK